MKILYAPLRLLFAAIFFLNLNACNTGAKNEATVSAKTDTVIPTAIKKSQLPEDSSVAPKAPVINMLDTLSTKQMVICIKDSAATAERIGLKLAQIYGVKLAAIIKKNKLKLSGAPIAWYNTSKAPFYFEAGLPIDKQPTKLPKGTTIKNIGVDSVIIAHFYGPYNMTSLAYSALGDWMKSHKKQMIGKPYEIYVDDPMDKDGKLKDPYKVRTDVVFTWH